jgi:hypothetical protein
MILVNDRNYDESLSRQKKLAMKTCGLWALPLTRARAANISLAWHGQWLPAFLQWVAVGMKSVGAGD